MSNIQSPSQMILPHVHQLLVTGKVNIPPARPQPVPTSKPKVFAPVPTGWSNMPFPVPTDRGYSSSVSFDWWKKEHIAVQRESKARTTLLQSILDDHVADFHYIGDARKIWNAVKARFGGNSKSKKIRKSMLKQKFLEFRISEAEGLHKGSQDTGDAGEFVLMGVTSE
nr:xylulose kinase-1 [Tanacetum cinerariifolium]